MSRRPKGASLVKKRSVVIGKQKTSLTLEDEFWFLLKELAAHDKLPVRQLVALIDKRPPARQLVVSDPPLRAGPLSPARQQGSAVGQEQALTMHKFHLGQSVAYRAPGRRLYASPGAYVVTARFPESDGEFEYHIRSADERYERMAREGELSAIAVEDTGSGDKGKR